MSRNRVLIVAPSAYTLGGLATWLDYLLPGLNQSGWDATLGLVSGPVHHLPHAYLEAHPCDDWIEILCSTGTQVGRIRAVQRALKNVEPDVVLSVNIPDALIATAQEKSKADIRSAMTCHGIQSDLFLDMQKLDGVIDAVVCTNKLACELSRSDAGWEAERVHYASYGTELFPLKSSMTKSQLTMGYAGRLEQEQKRIHDFPILINKLREQNIACEWLIAGDGPEEAALKSQLQREIQAGTVKFLGHVPAAELNEKFYQKIDGLYVSSSWETGPIVIWEAMAQSVPVVTSRYVGSGLEGALKHKQNCLMFDVGDMDQAAEQVGDLLNDSKLYRSVQEQGWDLIDQRYSHAASVQHWDSVLKAILAMPPLSTKRKVGLENTSSRLSRWVGEETAETLRTLLRKQTPDSGPAGEWPHRLNGSGVHVEGFWKNAAELDGSSYTFNTAVSEAPAC